MTGRPKDPKTARNKNVLVIGGSGSGKTRFYVKPNLMQCFPTSDYPTSFVVTDPKGTLVLETGQMFQRAGYRVKILNTINFSKSMKYNPFVYIHSEKDVLKLVNTLIANTKGEGEKSAEDFWVKSERLFYTALIGYIWYEAPAEEMNFTTLLEMINASEAREDDPDFQSPVDLMFERLEQKDPDHFAVRQYKKFLLSAGKTRSSILISCGARLAPFDIREVRELMEDDEMELDTIGDEKTVLFLIMSDTDTTFNFILAMLQSQLINLLCDRADDKYGGRLPVHVRLILDEFANIGQIPNFDKLIATIRSREISASIILQSQSQLKAIYKDAAEIISDNCDSVLFLSGRGKNAKEISDALGKETIDSFNTSENRGSQTSHGLNYQKLGKGKQLVPTKDGINLAVVLPESLTSPALTAEWENRLTEIAKGNADADEFMAEIEAQVRQLVKTYSCISADKQNLFQSERVIIGKCPRCGENVYEGKKNFYCGNRGCQFVMWKNDRFFEQRKKAFTPKIAAALLKNGKAKVKGLYSEKTGKTYDATVLLADTGGKYVNYRVERKE